MLVQLRASTARSAASAITRVARVNAVRGFIAPTVSRRDRNKETTRPTRAAASSDNGPRGLGFPFRLDCDLGRRLTTKLFTADFVQELYLKELKAYKPTPIKESDSVGQVQTFSAPKTPKSPEEADLASSLKEYESMAVEVEGQEAVAPGAAAPVVEDWLVEEEEDEPAHH
ncbi:hypothetical protein TruAng_001027 [Truncatella angustata]|nr:hypothetical protein TruAng_001027 [Truncatella angustata]